MEVPSLLLLLLYTFILSAAVFVLALSSLDVPEFIVAHCSSLACAPHFLAFHSQGLHERADWLSPCCLAEFDCGALYARSCNMHSFLSLAECIRFFCGKVLVQFFSGIT
uniref:Putative secreted protein n=1 Tax=Amblyomma triste TaxID=251400 RepID=A0A023G0H0_AMBTT